MQPGWVAKHYCRNPMLGAPRNLAAVAKGDLVRIAQQSRHKVAASALGEQTEHAVQLFLPLFE